MTAIDRIHDLIAFREEQSARTKRASYSSLRKPAPVLPLLYHVGMWSTIAAAVSTALAQIVIYINHC